jgi:4-hydroxythreonine-4-phosphate dehydrogenase
MTKDGIPILALTIGDAAGVGPEVCVKALTHSEIAVLYKPVVVGDRKTLESALQFLPSQRRPRFSDSAGLPDPSIPTESGTIAVYQPCAPLKNVQPGKLSAEAGHAAVEYIKAAVELGKAGRINGIVTAPINKEAIRLGGCQYPGHTEILAEGFGVKNYSLVLSARNIFVFHVTTHVSLRSALDMITQKRVYGQIKLAYLLSSVLGRGDEVIAVSGVNPHASENGLFGDEEELQIAPAVAQAQAEGIPVTGPLPADVLFPRMAKGQYKFCIAMYHDQGHAVFKSLYFDEGVNVTVGLPIIRTSVDHGTAFDIAGKGVANEDSMVEAIKLAALLGPKWSSISLEAAAL